MRYVVLSVSLFLWSLVAHAQTTVNQPAGFQIASATQGAHADYNKDINPVAEAGAVPAAFIQNASGEEIEVPLETRQLLIAGKCCFNNSLEFLRGALALIDDYPGYYCEQKLESAKRISLLVHSMVSIRFPNENAFLASFFENSSSQLTPDEIDILKKSSLNWMHQRENVLHEEVKAMQDNVKILEAIKTIPPKTNGNIESATSSQQSDQ